MKNNKIGVSAVIGVILMVAITVVIAAAVYVYVSDLSINEKQTITGNITYKGMHVGFGTVYYFILDNSTEVQVDYTDYMIYNIGEVYIYEV